jgi:capsular polysaccharide biosynthesis protein-like protein
VTNRDYVFDFERDGDQLDELLDSLDEKWGES